MLRKILGFDQDEGNEWRAVLDCGHRRHLRHDPPRESRPNLHDPAWRDQAIGVDIDCGRCRQRLLPQEAEVYRSTPEFNQDTVPKGLLANHSLKKGAWGKLVVLDGEVAFHEGSERTVVTPQIEHTILPEVVHHLELVGPVRFRVDFLACPARTEPSNLSPGED